MGTLINPRRPSPQDDIDFTAEPVYLRNPETGLIVKLRHKDTIARCLREFYTPSSEAEMRAQAIELAELQQRPVPPWAPGYKAPAALAIDPVAPSAIDEALSDPPVPSGRRPR